jgi:LemA protein
VERGRYNDSVQAYNTAVRTFPASLVAGMMGFQQSDAYFKSAAGADVAPTVDFK